MLQIGITGGIGSGKSTVANMFQVLGIPVLKSDDIAKQLMNEDAGLQQAIRKSFGEDIFKDGSLDRKKLAAIVFNDKEKLDILNSLVHPATIQYAEQWVLQQKAPYVLKEAALIFESGSYKKLDKVIGVSAPQSLRIQRAMKRDKLSEADIKQRMKRQMQEDEKMKRCDYIIYNDEHQPVIPQVLRLHKILLDIGHYSSSL